MGVGGALFVDPGGWASGGAWQDTFRELGGAVGMEHVFLQAPSAGDHESIFQPVKIMCRDIEVAKHMQIIMFRDIEVSKNW